MEENNEQLDYDEAELNNDRKCVPSNNKCYLNPNFTQQNALKVSNTKILPFESSHKTFQHSQPILHLQDNSLNNNAYHGVYFPQFSQNIPPDQSLPISQSSRGAAYYQAVVRPTIPIPNNVYINPSIFNSSQYYLHTSHHFKPKSSQTSQNWDLMVDDFVKKTVSARNYSNLRNRSSSSSSYSSRRSRSHCQPRSFSRESCCTSPPAQKRRKKSRDLNITKREVRPRKTQLSKQTIECAKVIGLDSEYLKKIEQQNKLREEIARKKSQHRKEIYTRECRRADNEHKNETIQQTNPNEGTSRQKAMTNRLRPYLAVVVTNVYGLDDPCRKVELIAKKIGPIKKVWQENEADVHLIFERHEDAKTFMQQYLGDSTAFDRVIDVTMKKVFLNTANIV